MASWVAAAAALLVSSGGVGCAGSAPADRTPGAPEIRGRAAEILARAIRHRTVNPPGDEAPLAAYLVRLLRTAGIEARLVPTPSEGSPVGRAAAWGRLPGSGQRKPLVLLSHLDVVPAGREGWSVPPFAGTQHDGFVYGRGALDAKGVAVVQALAMMELARRPQPLARDLIFLATPDEESGGRRGAGYLVKERRDLLGDAEYLLTEGGGVRLGREGQPAAWQIAVTEKSPCWLRLTSRAAPGHSSVPPADTAVSRLLAALTRIEKFQSERPIRVLPEVERMFAALVPLAAKRDVRGYKNLPSRLRKDRTFRRRFLAEPAHSALVRDTLTVTVLRSGRRTNVLPAEAVAHVDARLLPGEKCERFAREVRDAIDDPNIEIGILLAFPSRSSPIDTPLYDAIARVAAETDPGAVVVPRVLAGFTDAHYFREIGIISYGFVPLRHRVGDARGVHGNDERVLIADLERSVGTLVEILEELDRRDAED